MSADDEETARRSYLEARLRLAQEVAGVGTFEWDIVNDVNVWSAEIEALYGLPKGSFEGTYEAWRRRVHPDDLKSAEAHIQKALEDSDFSAEWRVIRPDGEVIWVQGRAIVEKDFSGKPLRMIGANIDITERKANEEHLRLLTAELHHRVKNSLATIQAIATQTLRTAPDMKSFTDSFLGRLHAIAAVHETLTETERGGASLGDMIRRQVSPFLEIDSDRISLSGPPIILGAASAHNLGLVLHELGSNALKYGALSVPQGRLHIQWWMVSHQGQRCAEVRWTETDGPPVQKPAQKGFGSRLIEQSLPASVGAYAGIDYCPEGLVARLIVPLERGGTHL